MSRSYWLSIIAVVGWIVLAGGAEAHSGGKGAYQHHLQAKEANSKPAQQTPTIAAQPVQAENVAPPCGDAGNHDNSDLCQQWRMAEAADQMVQISRLQVLLTFLSLLGLAGTIWYARRSAVHTLENGRAQVRAYVFVVPSEVTEMFKPAAIPTTFLRIVNKGQSPALRLHHISALRTFECPIKHPPAEFLRPADNQELPTNVWAHGEDEKIDVVGIENLSEEDLDSMLNSGPRRLYMIAKIFYEDVFGDSHITRFCAFTHIERGIAMRENGDEAIRISWQLTPFHNDAT